MAQFTEGSLVTSGSSQVDIKFRFKPYRASVAFGSDGLPDGCGPTTPDSCSVEVVNVGTPVRPKWRLRVRWNVSGVNRVTWRAYF